MKTDMNPFGIPDLTPMYEAVCAYVKEHQGEKGYIDTQDEGCDTIWSHEYETDTSVELLERHVKAVRVNRYGSLQVMTDNSNILYRDEDIRSAKDDAEDPDPRWKNVRNDDEIVYVQTLFNIAESIREYTGEKDDEPRNPDKLRILVSHSGDPALDVISVPRYIIETEYEDDVRLFLAALYGSTPLDEWKAGPYKGIPVRTLEFTEDDDAERFMAEHHDDKRSFL